ncbi:type II secretion system protein [Herbaspirillum sp. NPDC087042]|uniref:type II secretion system protein n=1 Tax=Herbaspirillum sp. NPDC087042 TaxID=3364004 RepID=UPI0038212601
MKKQQFGYTLVELSVVLALAGIVALGSVAGAMSLIDQQRINEFSAQNTDAIKRINDTYAQLPSYNGLSLRQAVSFGAFSQFIINQRATDNVTVTHPFGGAVGVAPVNGPTPLAWGLYLNAIPASHCIDLLFRSAPASDALVVFPGGMSNPVDWRGQIRLDASVPAIAIDGGLGGAGPLIAKNLTTNLSPDSLSRVCNLAGNRFGVLLLKSKL